MQNSVDLHVGVCVSLGESLEPCWSGGSGWAKRGRGWEQLEPEGNLGMERHQCALCCGPAAHNRLLCFIISSPVVSFALLIVHDSPLGRDMEEQEGQVLCSACPRHVGRDTGHGAGGGCLTLPHLWCHRLKKKLHHAETLPSSPSRCCSLVTRVKGFCFASVLPRKA